MQTQARIPAAERHAQPAAGAMDLADLVSVLVSLRSPSRAVDEVVEVMLGGSSVVPVVSRSAVISARWLSGETPAYTAGGGALSVLARRRGYRVHVSREDGRFRAEAWNLATGGSAIAAAATEGGAGIAAICSLASKETFRA